MKRLTPDRLIVIASLLIFLLAAFLSPGRQERNPLPSSYNSDPAGTQASYLLAGSLGYQVGRWEEPLSGLAAYGEGRTMLIAGPMMLSPSEIEDLNAFAQRGGRVVLFSSLPYGWFSSDQLQLEPNPEALLSEPEGTLLAYPQGLGSVTAGIETIAVRPLTWWRSHRGIVWFGHSKGPVVVGWRVGKGTIYAISDLYCISNQGLNEKDNLLLFLNLLGPPEKAGRIFFDEYHHGYRGGLAGLARRASVRRLALQAGLMMLLLLYSTARRFGPLRPLPLPDRRSPLEFVETMGEIYRHGRAPVAALEANYARFQQELGRRLGLPPDAPRKTIAQVAGQRLGLPVDEMVELIQWCEAERANPHADDEETHRRILQIHRILQEMRGRGISLPAAGKLQRKRG